MHRKTIMQLIQGLKKKEFSCFDIVKHYVERIKKFDNQLNSFITLTEADALTQAKIIDSKLVHRHNNQNYDFDNPHHRLAGIPIAYKDIFCTKGVKTSCGSKMLDNFISPYDATVVERLHNADCIMLGKTNMDEFAMGSSNETSYYGTVKNPWDLTKVAGGSSGGSAAAVSAHLAPVSFGTDTGGSVRQPGALCGVTALKPTYGLISRYGIAAFASSLDQAGIFAKTAEDIALILSVAAGLDNKDSTSVTTTVPDYTKTLAAPLTGLKIGLPKEYFNASLDKNIVAVLNAAILELEKLGAKTKEISLPNTNLAIPVYYVIAPAECSSNLSRYDGVRYGYRCNNPKDLNDLYTRSRTEGFGDEVKRRIMIGTYVLSAGYYDAYYLKAQKVRQLIKNDFITAFSNVDIILSLTSPTVAFNLGEKAQDPINMYLSDIYTVSVNLAGLPGISVPIGFSHNLPVGMQLIGNYFTEAKLLNIAHQYQGVTDWHSKIPPQFA